MKASKHSQNLIQSKAAKWAVSPIYRLRRPAETHDPPDIETQPDAVDSQQAQEKADRGAKTAENVRYGQTISEGGMGGRITESEGSANQGTFMSLFDRRLGC